mmetsp:Transcript_11853/g.30060  ORF Transcript_11853/g.30060 Transcript_11853/m.30060 type:complete len:315 (-) Transcript_11853:109-1053(-)
MVSFYTDDEVRTAAKGTSFHEISHTKNSRVVSFESDSGTRINVYCTNGAIGICLNHPLTKGKTQIFRRSVDLDRLQHIFLDPRITIHPTGKGYLYYYRANNRQSWKTVKDDGHEIFEVDSARRWRYVASATDLSTSSYELDKMAEFCNLFDSIYWDRGAEPKLSEKRYGCTGKLILSNMLFQVAEDLLGYPLKAVYMGNARADKPDVFPNQACPCNCCLRHLADFREDHNDDVLHLTNMLQSFRRDVQIEMIQWFFGRDYCGYRFVGDGNLRQHIVTRYTAAVHSAQLDYADIAYTSKNARRMCTYHGVVWDDA